MKNKKLLILISILTLLIMLFCFVGCTNNNSQANQTPTGDNESLDNNGNQNNDNQNNNNDNQSNVDENGGETPAQQIESMYVTINSNEKQNLAKNKLNQDGKQVLIFNINLELTKGDRVAITDDLGNEYSLITDNFDGTANADGEYYFEIRIIDNIHSVLVNVPEVKPIDPETPDNPDDTNNTDDTDNPVDSLPTVNTTITIYFTDNAGWANAYAYCWNDSTKSVQASWPGTKLKQSGTAYGKKQYSYTVDTTKYNRIIFNNGAGEQTITMTLSPASSGFYTEGKSGSDWLVKTFTEGTNDYGKVEYFHLTDREHLSYLSAQGYSKKISVYTPPNYDPNKKYGVLYMFDSQNLYVAADGCETSHDSFGSWSVDVAVTSLVQNGADGVIIVAIDCTDGHRDSELTISQAFGGIDPNLADNNDFYNGKLDDLGDFMRYTLIPWVNTHYSVDTRVCKTGIAGSSSGGLAAYYLGLRDNDIYGYIGAFSPANGLFYQNAWNNFYAKKDFSNLRPQVYAYCGSCDNFLEDMLLPATKQIINLTKYGYSKNEITEYYSGDNAHVTEHTETYWRAVFMEFLAKYCCY